MLISICGKSGSGKSTLALKMKEKYPKIVYIDIDKIAHQVLLYPEVKEKIKTFFGKEIMENDEVNRKKLSQIVFDDEKKKEFLMNLTWPYMEKEIDKIIQKNHHNIIILDYLLLPMTKYYKESKIKILLDIPTSIRKERIIKRDNIDEELFVLRDKSSILYNEQDFNYILRDDEDIKNLLSKVSIFEKKFN